MTAEMGSQRPGFVPGLDGIRALAILLVILWHSAIRTPRFLSGLGLLRVPTLMGWAGVDLFFALSGFLITGLILSEERASGRIDLRRFYVRRALRIFPAFYLVLLVDVLVLRKLTPFGSLAGALSGGATELVALATYWSNYFYAYGPHALPPAALAVFWSLCVEEHFYLLWPAFLVAVRSARARVATAVAVCALVPVGRFVAARSAADADLTVRFLSHFRMDALLWGGLAALAVGTLPRPRRIAAALLLASGAVLAALIAGRHLAGYLTPLGYSLGFSALAAFGSALAVEVSQAPGRLLARSLSFAPLRAIGRVSYGMYLIHFQILDLLQPRVVAVFRPRKGPVLYTLLVAGLVAAGTFVVALILNRIYERPFLRLKERFTPPRQALPQGTS